MSITADQASQEYLRQRQQLLETQESAKTLTRQENTFILNTEQGQEFFDDSDLIVAVDKTIPALVRQLNRHSQIAGDIAKILANPNDHPLITVQASVSIHSDPDQKGQLIRCPQHQQAGYYYQQLILRPSPFGLSMAIREIMHLETKPDFQVQIKESVSYEMKRQIVRLGENPDYLIRAIIQAAYSLGGNQISTGGFIAP